ncbi:Protein kinase-like domain [Pseudocohnilembus persalinus]|uniref:cGMP-dependent protein kinase n=1 Tax=Pseudocohnilembus persalinus TaxID=266149 RepID=A0A0V0R7K9_PSEPJ|nr:Protein kinase-like domain [Pseudocohnilembus persalinus]|eukprot:KRX10479.1 Protein kinase-like domain [Pseudocohnilembus persalinus]
MFYCKVEKDQYLMKEGDQGSCFFIVEQGKVQIIVGDQIKKEIMPGTGLGEFALLYKAERSASIKALEDCYFWGIERYEFKNTIDLMNQKKRDQNYQLINKTKLFDDLTKEQKISLSQAFYTQKFKKGEGILFQNDPANSFYIVQQGEVTCLKNGEQVRIFQKGESFGEQSLLEGKQKRNLSIIAKSEEVYLIAIGKKDITEILAQNQSSSASQIEEEDTEDLGSNQNFNNLNLISNIDKNKNQSSDQNESGLKMSEYSSSDQDQNQIQNQIQSDFQNNFNTNDDQLQIQEESQIEVKIEKRENFGFDIVVEKNSVICQFNLDQVKEIFGDDIENLINASKNVTNNLIKYHHSKSKSIDQKQDLKLEDLEALQVLGEGQFGYVILVRERNNKDKYYALKIISKFLMQQMKTQKHVKTEKDIMEGIQHPFITQFYKAYQDKYNVYFLMEFVQGIELFDAIRDIGLLGTAEAQFFMSQILLQIEFLHQKDIIYRDLKPENIMIDKSGYLKLIDFGSPRKLSDNQRSYTILGTPHYMAPEVLSGKGYGKNADLWSMGICLFEFMSGMVPYGEDAEDPMTIYQEILKKQIVFPEFFVDSEAKKFVEILLQKNPEFRMPGQNFASLKQVGWFEDFDWESLQLKQMKCQYQPSDNELLNLDKFKDKIGMGIQQFYQKNISILHIPEQNHELKKWEDEFSQKN